MEDIEMNCGTHKYQQFRDGTRLCCYCFCDKCHIKNGNCICPACENPSHEHSIKTSPTEDFRTPPEHYAGDGGMQPWDVVDAFGLGYYGGNALKYLLRAGKKPGEARDKDLGKAIDYLKKMIADGVN